MEHHFERSVLAIGVVGFLANLVMLYSLIESKSRSDSTIMVFNQMIHDLVGCLFLIVVYAMKIAEINYTSFEGGVLLCKIFGNEALFWSVLISSISNLTLLTLERYLKIVHPTVHRNHFRRWMYYVAIGFTWLNFVALGNMVASALTTDTSGGRCSSLNWPNQDFRTGYAIWTYLMAFALPLVVLMFCYSRILNVIRNRINTVPANFNNMIKSVALQNTLRSQMNVIRTFILISVCFVVCLSPNQTYFFLLNIKVFTNLDQNARYVTVFMAICNVALNPFIYAGHLDPVKKVLRNTLCRKGRRLNEGQDTMVAVVSLNDTA